MLSAFPCSKKHLQADFLNILEAALFTAIFFSMSLYFKSITFKRLIMYFSLFYIYVTAMNNNIIWLFGPLPRSANVRWFIDHLVNLFLKTKKLQPSVM